MDKSTFEQAKSILDIVLNEFFTKKPTKENLQYLEMNYANLANLLEAADFLLFEGLAQE